jgi:class III poly(R)-hydroxyalkanoic acid synthase PhaE subunit
MSAAEKQAGFDWFQSQQQFWNSFTQNQWSSVMDAWKTQQSTNQNSGFGADTYARMFTEAGKSFLNMIGQFSPDKKPVDALQEWTKAMESFFKQGSHQSPFSAQFADPFGFAASMPGIGYTREKQEQMGEVYRLWSAFQTQSQRYNSEMTKVGLEALKSFTGYLNNPPADAKPLHSIKDVFAKWVDVAEDVYSKYAMSEEYTKMYGEVVNSLMHFKKKYQEFTDDTLDKLNIPTRREVDSLHKRVHDLMRENIQLRKDLDGLMGKTSAKTAKKGKKA